MLNEQVLASEIGQLVEGIDKDSSQIAETLTLTSKFVLKRACGSESCEQLANLVDIIAIRCEFATPITICR